MLDVGAQAVLGAVSTLDEWDAIPSRAEVPRDLEGYFDREGPMPSSVEERRSLARYYLRQRAVLRAGGVFHAGYTRDISRSGMGLISPVQLFPLDEVRVWLPEREAMTMRVVRCVRLDDRCYSCGAVFISADASSP